MAFRVEISPVAEKDAEAILTWLIAEQAGTAGLHWFVALYEAIDSLEQLPARCALAPEDKEFSVEVRQLFYGRKPHQYRILFTIQSETVIVLHIRHGRRDVVTH